MEPGSVVQISVQPAFQLLDRVERRVVFGPLLLEKLIVVLQDLLTDDICPLAPVIDPDDFRVSREKG